MTWRKQDWAYQRLREWILSGRLAPDERLDQEGLAKELGISRIPLRQAMARLAAEGLLVDRPHQRWVVAQISVPDLRDVYSGREALETMLAYEAATAITPAQVREIEEILEDQRRAAQRDDLQRVRVLDRQFHFAIYQCAQMSRSLEVLDKLHAHSDRYIRMFLSDPERATAALDEHEAIVSALLAADPDAVREATRSHITRGLVDLTALLTAASTESTDEGPTG
ncbi:GntR family transcriptional regulator [Micromonospora sp. NPDC047740]|uniref:GntR family transcriptional regulator n=1 Tax=Micromonospora sp. NPDC047740 TaxID=3364254 RepID=UPI0037153C81